MANQSTRRLRKSGLSLKFNKGADFSHLSGASRAAHPEFSIVESPSTKGRCVDTSTANAPANGSKRKSPWKGVPSARRSNQD